MKVESNKLLKIIFYTLILLTLFLICPFRASGLLSIGDLANKTTVSEYKTSLKYFYNTLDSPSDHIFSTNLFDCGATSCKANDLNDTGLLSLYEYNKIGGLNSYIDPYVPFYIRNSSSVNEVTNSGIKENTATSGMRPVIYLKEDTVVTGMGTVDDPYVISEFSDLNIVGYTVDGNTTDSSFDYLLANNIVKNINCQKGTKATWNYESETMDVSDVVIGDSCIINFTLGNTISLFAGSTGTVAAPVSKTVKYNGTVTFTVTPNNGYENVLEENTCGGTLSGNTYTIQKVTKSQVCTITFNPITYTVTLDNQGATSAGTTLVYYKYNTVKNINGTNYYYFSDKSLTSALSSINKPTKTGYTFGGYYSGTNGTGTQYINANGKFSNNLYKTINDKVLYAKWSLNQYKLTLTKGTGVSAMYYKVNGASSYTKVTATTTLNVNYNSKYYYYAEASAGYSLSACTASSPCEGTMGSSAVNKTLSANIISYKVTLTVSGGVGSTSKNINYNSSGTFTGVKPNSGYTATGATLTCNGGATIGLSGTTVTVSKVTKTQTCTVKFKPNIKLLDRLLADNPTRKTRTDFSKRFAADNTKTLYTSTETISGISSTKTVYYFAGNAKNNWVKFGGYLWRIIRTNHDSSIRLLYSGTVEQGFNNTDGVILYDMAFNYDNNSPKYVGYMYGSSDSSLDNIRGNTASSTIKSYIDSWYKATDLYGNFVGSDLRDYHLDSKFKLRFKLQNYENYLSKDAVYCADRNLASGYSYSRSGEFLFKIEDRIPDWYSLSKITPKPTYDCTNIKDAFSGNNTKAQLKCADGSGICPVGLMTADEVTFAGGINDHNLNEPFPWYMKNISSVYWLMTPTRYDKPYGKNEAYAGTSTVKKDSSAGGNYVTNSGWVRPVTSLKACVLWKSGDGSASNPYEIVENGGC